MVNMPKCSYCKKEVDLLGDYFLIREYQEGELASSDVFCNITCLKKFIEGVE